MVRLAAWLDNASCGHGCCRELARSDLGRMLVEYEAMRMALVAFVNSAEVDKDTVWNEARVALALGTRR